VATHALRSKKRATGERACGVTLLDLRSSRERANRDDEVEEKR